MATITTTPEQKLRKVVVWKTDFYLRSENNDETVYTYSVYRVIIVQLFVKRMTLWWRYRFDQSTSKTAVVIYFLTTAIPVLNKFYLANSGCVNPKFTTQLFH